MKISILTLFPEMYENFLNSSIIGRSISRGIVDIELVNIRDFSKDKTKRVDDRPIGGGAGLIMKLEPLVAALRSVKTKESHIVLLAPTGKHYAHETACDYSSKKHLIIVCGHYEGIDFRFEKYVDEIVSIGDYVLTGGELASMVIVDSVVRLLPGAISEESTVDESFTDENLLEYPQYTFPIVFEGKSVPNILLTGNHEAVDYYHKKQAIKLTIERRPDLLKNRVWNEVERKMINEIKTGELSAIEKTSLDNAARFLHKYKE